MTQIYITIGIIAIIAALVCYVFIRQTIGERKREKERLNRVLAKRAKELLQLLGAFPDHFLPKELVVFVYRCIIDAYEQLTKLEPSENRHIESLKMHSSQLDVTLRNQGNAKAADLQSVNQINELRQYLNLLGSFLQKSLQRNQITPKQHAQYRQLVKEMIIRLAVNNYMITAKQALEIQKSKLALHYYDLAKKLLERETPSNYQESMQTINQAMEPLLALEQAEQAAEITQTESTDANAAAPEEKSEWDDFQEDSGWQKKNVYD
jgi:hypothetical protein